jgi:transcriptional regulator with XRE-family HTH domain
MSELKRIRDERGLPQETIARKARIGQSTYSMYERGALPVPQKIAVRIARVLRVEVNELFTDDSR